MGMHVGIITISDRASEGVYEDLGGPALKKAAEGRGWTVQAEAIVPAEQVFIRNAVRSFSAPAWGHLLTTSATAPPPPRVPHRER